MDVLNPQPGDTLVAEVIINPNDSRPIVIQLVRESDGSMDVRSSAGPMDDVILAKEVLNFLANQLADILWAGNRKIIDGFFAPEKETPSVDTDEIPF